MLTAVLVAAGLQAASAIIIWLLKRQKDILTNALSSEKAAHTQDNQRHEEVLTTIKNALTSMEKQRDQALLAAQDNNVRGDERVKSLQAEVAELEKDLAACKTPDALRARLNNLNSLLQGKGG